MKGKKKYIWGFLGSAILSSCLFVFDSMEQMRIINRTNDTILIGKADYNIIDSAQWVINRWWAKYDSTWTRTNHMGTLEISKGDLIPHDSAGCYAATTLLGHSKEHKVYFFIIKYEIAKKHSWKEICEKQLYDTMVVTQEMLNENKSRIFEYKGGK